ncbi:glycerophosphodiester phosphodiesterase family protein [Shivajiella indica]|uniref:Glycerophosphodiester phosphodiesterase family protein n=1 Tax=Shivajiella indica TaxID=872115 RepID=A0ABW5B4R7_9BACT
MSRAIIIAFFTFLTMTVQAQFSYDLQGHRGSRGLMPENTIPAMIKALDLGVTTLELDLAVTKDGEIILSHEPYMNPAICFTPNGEEILPTDKSHNIYQMTYAEVIQFDCGTKFHAGFPKQVKFFATKPKLSDMIDVVEKYVTDMGLPLPNYNIEIKCMPEGDGVYHPNPEDFSEMVIALLSKKLKPERFNIQSFDFRVLQYIHQHHPGITLAMLVENAVNPEEQLRVLGFQPQIYSPFFPALNKETVQKLQQKGMKVIPWTVNNKEQMEKLLDMGVDGIITDYPNLAPVR